MEKQRPGVVPGLSIGNTKLKLSFADLEHLGTTDGADPLGSRSAVLHGDGLGAFHDPLGAAFHAITFHKYPPS